MEKGGRKESEFSKVVPSFFSSCPQLLRSGNTRGFSLRDIHEV